MLSIGTRSECLHRSDLLSQLISFRDVRLNEVRLDAGPAESDDQVNEVADAVDRNET